MSIYKNFGLWWWQDIRSPVFIFHASAIATATPYSNLEQTLARCDRNCMLLNPQFLLIQNLCKSC
ncbi:hypothetical protein [aff. Roholtiella sp. LEGE 12411]|uniref:hypothetical protein n=1 Tax=aff. Roholtiella sp. LEGE 12411 TaxID=1828822 RepID=UPI001882448F|nr:hypothetical protein [aff. Roholtiella sp. LEGE 12411]MBE9038221.1 hypothetical protein [aff. Roholtiella sp. LEGE 12411]